MREGGRGEGGRERERGGRGEGGREGGRERYISKSEKVSKKGGSGRGFYCAYLRHRCGVN